MSTPATRIEPLATVDSFVIHGAHTPTNRGQLDPITVILLDFGSGRGQIIVECYGSAWSTYFGAMGCTLREFICSINAGYLSNRLACNTVQAPSKRMDEYAERVSTAVIEAVKTQAGTTP